MRTSPTGGVTGTVEAFNFIRRVGFPPTPEIVSIFTAVSFLSTIVSLPISGESLLGTMAFATVALVGPAVVAEFLNSTLILHKDHVLNFRRLMGLELTSLLPMVAILPVSSVIGLVVGVQGLWVDGFLIGLIVSL